jgi:hypothetical protein
MNAIDTDTTIETGYAGDDVRAIGADDVLNFLRAQFCAAVAARNAAHTASLAASGEGAARPLLAESDAHGARAIARATTICTTQASGLRGALTQIEVLRGLDCMAIEGALYAGLAAAALASIGRVLAGAVRRSRQAT